MKILHILNSNSFSGAENVVCQIIDMFNDELDIQMAYCSPEGPIKYELEKKNIQYISIKKLNLKNLKKVIKSFKPDIIHAHDFKASILTSFLHFKGKIISHIHNNDPKMTTVSIKSLLYNFRIKKFDKVLGVSQSVLEESRFKKKISKKFLMIGNPVNVKAIRKDIKKEEKKYDVIFVGRLTRQKDPSRFVTIVSKIAENNKNIKCLMLGDGELRQEVHDLICSYGLYDNIEMLGFKNNVYDYINQSKMLFITSLWEGFGLVVIEALSLGVPVAATPVGGLPDLVICGAGKICACDNDFIDFYNLLTNDKNAYLAYSQAAYNRADELNNIEEYKKILFNVYRGI